MPCNVPTAVEFQRDVAHAERIEQFAPREGQRLLGAADGIADDPRQQLRRSRWNNAIACPGGAISGAFTAKPAMSSCR